VLLQAEQELQRSREAIRELRMKCKELAQELEQARRRPNSYSRWAEHDQRACAQPHRSW
jgi:hypothetical protein